MNFLIRSSVLTSLVIATAAMVIFLPEASAETKPAALTPGFVFVDGASRCTNLSYPSPKEVAVFKKTGTGTSTRCSRLWAKRAAKAKTLPNVAPSVSVFASLEKMSAYAYDDVVGISDGSASVPLVVHAVDPEGDELLYTWSVTGGRISGNGGRVRWDPRGLRPGSYTLTVEVDDGCGCIAFASASIAVKAE